MFASSSLRAEWCIATHQSRAHLTLSCQVLWEMPATQKLLSEKETS